jgi:hypothetical protein
MWRRLKAPDTWVAIFSFMALAGIVCSVLGMVLRIKMLVPLGLSLGIPLALTAILLCVVVIPFLIFSNSRFRNRR